MQTNPAILLVEKGVWVIPIICSRVSRGALRAGAFCPFLKSPWCVEAIHKSFSAALRFGSLFRLFHVPRCAKPLPRSRGRERRRTCRNLFSGLASQNREHNDVR